MTGGAKRIGRTIALELAGRGANVAVHYHTSAAQAESVVEEIEARGVKALAPEVQVNAVAPGPVLPPDDLGPAERQAIMRATPLRRFGTPEDVARCVRFLVEEAGFSTGAVFLVDGGRLIA